MAIRHVFSARDNPSVADRHEVYFWPTELREVKWSS
jgi:hypothetical protein